MRGIMLIFFACLANNPKECKEVRISYAGTNVTKDECIQLNFAWLAAWQAEHPPWRIDWSRKRQCTDNPEESI